MLTGNRARVIGVASICLGILVTTVIWTQIYSDNGGADVILLGADWLTPITAPDARVGIEQSGIESGGLKVSTTSGSRKTVTGNGPPPPHIVGSQRKQKQVGVDFASLGLKERLDGLSLRDVQQLMLDTSVEVTVSSSLDDSGNERGVERAGMDTEMDALFSEIQAVFRAPANPAETVTPILGPLSVDMTGVKSTASSYTHFPRPLTHSKSSADQGKLTCERCDLRLQPVLQELFSDMNEGECDIDVSYNLTNFPGELHAIQRSGVLYRHSWGLGDAPGTTIAATTAITDTEIPGSSTEGDDLGDNADEDQESMIAPLWIRFMGDSVLRHEFLHLLESVAPSSWYTKSWNYRMMCCGAAMAVTDEEFREKYGWGLPNDLTVTPAVVTPDAVCRGFDSDIKYDVSQVTDTILRPHVRRRDSPRSPSPGYGRASTTSVQETPPFCVSIEMLGFMDDTFSDVLEKGLWVSAFVPTVVITNTGIWEFDAMWTGDLASRTVRHVMDRLREKMTQQQARLEALPPADAPWRRADIRMIWHSANKIADRRHYHMCHIHAEAQDILQAVVARHAGATAVESLLANLSSPANWTQSVISGSRVAFWNTSEGQQAAVDWLKSIQADVAEIKTILERVAKSFIQTWLPGFDEVMDLINNAKREVFRSMVSPDRDGYLAPGLYLDTMIDVNAFTREWPFTNSDGLHHMNQLSNIVTMLDFNSIAGQLRGDVICKKK